MTPALSLILPANNEEAHIGACLQAVLASDSLACDAPVQIVVVPNGCSDATAQIARSYQAKANARGWQLDVIELDQGSKIAALNAGETTALAPAFVYLDADVIVGPALLAQTADALDADDARYVSGQVQLSTSPSFATRAYGAFYLHTPFMRQCAPGCGYFAMNNAGRTRWADWPAIISDDTFARLNFAPDERRQVSAPYEWPLVEGLRNLVRVRRRQNAGVEEIEQRFPDLLKNDAKTRFTPAAIMNAAVRHPIGFLIYGIVALVVKISPARNSEWKRGR